ncbi:type 1 glutamine amidotransferase domain-containing protein [Noviherbaspirillum galbum]|uniref:Type 1 glutamine amidotransferase n=1 Tax=Noviherbaspirillum galbum TaxID=2709383 RepID=A0A6B3SR29_9BURK|nr:type 1 glutamine amidotransferase domain-containing protein [Noviherbaspirillum galbum]NEX63213.1 type 1 glutamine amidotransferase [Noviherbaspirillum galbum]
MELTLTGINVAVLLTDGFEQVEYTGPRDALEQQGAALKVISLRKGEVQGMHHHDQGDMFRVDLLFSEADPKSFDMLLLPGGEQNGATLRDSPEAQAFVHAFEEDGKPIAAICHGGWVLAAAGLVQGRRMTSWESLQDDFRKAGANWVDEEVVVDGNLVTSRKPDDIPAFNKKMVDVMFQRLAAHTAGTSEDRRHRSSVGFGG